MRPTPYQPDGLPIQFQVHIGGLFNGSARGRGFFFTGVWALRICSFPQNWQV